MLGLDPALAIVHADTRGRDSLPLDLLGAVRPGVERPPVTPVDPEPATSSRRLVEAGLMYPRSAGT